MLKTTSVTSRITINDHKLIDAKQFPCGCHSKVAFQKTFSDVFFTDTRPGHTLDYFDTRFCI